MKLKELTPLLSVDNRFQQYWNPSETPVSSFKSVSPSLKPLIYRKINTYIEQFHSFSNLGCNLWSGPRSCFAVWKLFLTDDEVSPLDETALVTAVSIPSNVRLETSRLGPKMTAHGQIRGAPGDETSVGGVDIVRIRGAAHLRDREFPEARSAESE